MPRKAVNKPWFHAASGLYCATVNGKREYLDADFSIACRKLRQFRRQARQPRTGWREWLEAPFAELAAEFLEDNQARRSAARWLLEPVLADTVPFITLFGAVAIAVWVGGYRPALLVAVLGYFASAYLFFEPPGGFGLSSTRNLVSLVAYLITCGIITGFGESLRRAKQHAEERQELLRITLASIGDAVITTDAGGRVVALNTVAESLSGWTNKEAAGQPLEAVFRILNEATRETAPNPAAKALKDGVVVGLANHTLLVAKDGKEYAIEDSAAPIRSREGQTVGCVLVFRDVSERRQLEKENASRPSHGQTGRPANSDEAACRPVLAEAGAIVTFIGCPVVGGDGSRWKENHAPSDTDMIDIGTSGSFPQPLKCACDRTSRGGEWGLARLTSWAMRTEPVNREHLGAVAADAQWRKRFARTTTKKLIVNMPIAPSIMAISRIRGAGSTSP
jgi:PAS domain S-box-containing protein